MPCIHTCGPDQALVKSGLCLGKPTIVPGGCVFSIPVVQKVQRLNLSVMTLEIYSPLVYTLQGVPLSVSSIAQIKISRYPESLRNAAGQFLDMPWSEVENVAQQTLEGHQRAIMGGMTVEEIYQDRKKFAREVREVAGVDVGNLGLEIVSYTIKDVKDDEGYLDSLGRKKIAEVKRDARIGEAEAERDAGVKEAEANRAKMGAVYQADTVVADSKRMFELKQAAFDQEVNAKQAESGLAYNLQSAKTKQNIKNEQMEISVIERKKLIEIEQQEVERKEKELEATVKRPAEAEKFKLETLAEGNRARVIMEADARAQSAQLVGEAEADVIKAKGVAEAEKMTAKSDAWKEYTDGAYMEMIIQRLPQIAEQIAKPLTKTEKIVIVNSGQGGGQSQLTSDITDLVAQLPPVVQSLTGTDITQALKKLTA